MEKNVSVATLSLLGGHPALDFANTVNSRRGRWGPDLLVGFGDLLQWAERTHVLEPEVVEGLADFAATRPEESVAALGAAKTLREAIYETFSALSAGQDAPEEALTLLRREYLKAQANRVLSRDGASITWAWAGTASLDTVTQRLAIAAVDLLTGSNTRRVKECFGRNCGWLFLDTSRNGSRRWCSDAVCGSLERVTRHRKRVRERPSCEET